MERLAPGTPFGPYVVEGLIASGGMGSVYAAHHGVYAGSVALKVLHPALHADSGWRHRFNEEGLVGAQLKHPHVLSARELVEHDGAIALVLDLVAGGQTLEKVMAREYPDGLGVALALQITLGIVQGVEYLHAKGIIHGDMKPDNVLIEGDHRAPERWVPKVTDFGTVALIAHPVLLRGRPAVVATPRYASPEHLDGVDALRPESDIYGIGLVLHFLLTGRHASDARSVQEAAFRVYDPVPEIHLVDHPEAVREVFRRCVPVSPDERFPNCRELALAIRRTLDAIGHRIELADLAADLATEVNEDAPPAPGDATEAVDDAASSRASVLDDDPTDEAVDVDEAGAIEPAPDPDELPELERGDLHSVVAPVPERPQPVSEPEGDAADNQDRTSAVDGQAETLDMPDPAVASATSNSIAPGPDLPTEGEGDPFADEGSPVRPQMGAPTEVPTEKGPPLGASPDSSTVLAVPDAAAAVLNTEPNTVSRTHPPVASSTSPGLPLWVWLVALLAVVAVGGILIATL